MFGWGIVVDIYLRSVSRRKRKGRGKRKIAEFPCPRCGEIELCAECDRVEEFLPAPRGTVRARAGKTVRRP